MYILECAGASYYVGSTIHVERRREQHHAGEDLPTRCRLPVTSSTTKNSAPSRTPSPGEEQVQDEGRATHIA